MIVMAGCIDADDHLADDLVWGERGQLTLSMPSPQLYQPRVKAMIESWPNILTKKDQENNSPPRKNLKQKVTYPQSLLDPPHLAIPFQGKFCSLSATDS